MNHLGHKINDVLKYKRLSKCKECNCKVDFSDPNSSCPNKNWGKVLITENGWKEVVEMPTLNINPPQVEYPKKIEQIKNFLKSSKEELTSIYNGTESLTEKEKEKRLEICRSCNFFDQRSNRCKKCGCYMPIKTTWRSQKCPIGKW